MTRSNSRSAEAQRWLVAAEQLRQKGLADSAVAALRAAVSMDPRLLPAHNALGYALLAQSRPAEALESFNAAVSLSGRSAEALHGQGTALAALDRHTEAVVCYRAALAVTPKHANTLFNLGNSLSALGLHVEALAAFDAAILSKPTHAAAYENRCRSLTVLGRVDAAIASMREVVRLCGGSAVTLRKLGRLLMLHGRAISEVLEAFDAALRADPHLPFLAGDRLWARLWACHWDGLSEEAARALQALRAEQSVLEPLVCTSISEAVEDQSLSAKVVVRDRCGPQVTAPHGGARHDHDRIRIAYLSGDFREHPVARVMAPVIEHHDKSAFEVIGLSFLAASDNDPMRARLRGACNRFVDVWGHGDSHIVQLMRELEVDIAIDLTGHTANARLPVFALRGAPIQVNYLGYPGTAGSAQWDYIIADHTVLPVEHESHYSERVVRLPDCYLAYDPPDLTGVITGSRAEQGLPEDAFVFFVPHTSYKITPEFFDIWMRLLKSLDSSVLWLNIHDPTAVGNLRREAERRGVCGERLIFAKYTRTVGEHLARSALADLVLDTLPYNAHVTACDMLAVGVPVLTCLGSTFAGRVCASALSAAGLPELVTRSAREYEETALRLGSTPGLCASFRGRLLTNRRERPLFDVRRFTQNLERVYRRMWQLAQSGEAPQSFTIG